MHIEETPTSDRTAARPWVTVDLMTITTALFWSAMGANAFVQYVVPYLVEVRAWRYGEAVSVLVLGFGLMPITRYLYAPLQRRLGDHGALVAGHLLFIVFLVTLMTASAPWRIVVAGTALAGAAALVFTAGPLQILDQSPAAWRGRASGLFFAANFLAWFVAVTVQNAVIRVWGLDATSYVAMGLTLAGLVLLLFVPPRVATREHIAVRASLPVLTRPPIPAVLLLMLVSSVAFGIMFGPLPAYVVDAYGPSALWLLTAGFYLARLPGSLVTGALADHVDLASILFVVFAVTGVGLLVAAISQSLWILLVAIVLLGIQQAAVPVAAMALAGKTVGTEQSHLVYVPAFAAAELGVALALSLTTLFEQAETGGRSSFLWFGLLYIVAAGIAKRTRHR